MNFHALKVLLTGTILLAIVGCSGSSSDSGVSSGTFAKSIDVFGVNVAGKACVGDDKLLYAARVMAEYLDQDENGVADNALLINTMKNRKACLEMSCPGAGGARPGCQDLFTNETNPGSLPGPNAAFEEILHVITTQGYSYAYPGVWGEKKGSTVAGFMDKARGGYQGGGQPVDSYPAGAWYHYEDPSCDYNCQVSEYIYWGVTSLMGAQAQRCNEIANEWELCSADLVASRDVGLYGLITTPSYAMPRRLPDGNYAAIPLTIVTE